MSAATGTPPTGVDQEATPQCVWCGTPARPAGRMLALCTACGAASTYPQPTAAELDEAYAGWYRPAGGRFSGGGERLLRASRGALARRVDSQAPPGPVLDVGSGEGALLDALAKRGREAIGLERESTRPGVRACELTSFDERPGEWAAVVFWHSLEHLSAPGEAIDRAVALLAPRGLLIVAVPNWGSWQSRLFGERWFARDLPRHLVHLPSSALLTGLRRRGLRIERVSYWRGGQVLFGWLHGLVSRMSGGLDLYDAIRRPDARRARGSSRATGTSLALALATAPVAACLAIAEVVGRAGGTVYVEARKS